MSRKNQLASDAKNVATLTIPAYRVGLYTRLSVEDIRKKESDSIGTQVALLRQYVDNQSDMVEAELYQDIDKTGTNFDRAAFNQMLDDIKAKKINCVIVKDLSRFGRNHIETGNYLERIFPFMGVRFIAISDNYDSNNPASNGLIVPIKNLINEIYAKDISKKIRSQVAVKRKKGEFCGSVAPYGYIKIGNRFVVDEVAAKVVVRVFNMVLEGHSDNVIAKTLNSLGILPPKAHSYAQGILKGEKHSNYKYWYTSMIKRLTENSAYVGNMAQGKTQKILMAGSKVEYIPRNHWTVVESTHDAIVEQGVFEAVQKIRKKRYEMHQLKQSNSTLSTASENIFKGILKCKECSRNMGRKKTIRENGKPYYRYACPTITLVENYTCCKKGLDETELLEIVKSFINTQLSILADVKIIINKLNKHDNFISQTNRLYTQIQKTKGELARATKFRTLLYEDTKLGVLSEDDYKLAKAEYGTKIDKLTNQLLRYEEEKHKKENTISNNTWVNILESLGSFETLTRELVVIVVERIEVDKNKEVHIFVKYCDEYTRLLKILGESKK